MASMKIGGNKSGKKTSMFSNEELKKLASGKGKVADKARKELIKRGVDLTQETE